MAERHIIANKVRCKHCGDVIQSHHRHDLKWCKCGSVAVDGGISHLRRLWRAGDSGQAFEELSELVPASAPRLAESKERAE